MIWADRVAIAWALVLVLFFLVIGNDPIHAGFFSFWVKMLAILAGVPWVILRAIHFAATGRIGRQRGV